MGPVGDPFVYTYNLVASLAWAASFYSFSPVAYLASDTLLSDAASSVS